MITVNPATEDEMILAFLVAEIDASRYAPIYRGGLAQLGVNRALIDKPDLGDAAANSTRKKLLGKIRGYGSNAFLFSGFPGDVKWRHAILDREDFERMRYAKHQTWVDLSNATRLISDGARNLDRQGHSGTDHIPAIIAALRRGEHFPEIIAVDVADGSLILVEGHSRATAYVLAECTEGIEAIVGSSPSMPEWVFY